MSYDEPLEPEYCVPTDAEQLAALKNVRRCAEELAVGFKMLPSGADIEYVGSSNRLDDLWEALNDYHDLFLILRRD